MDRLWSELQFCHQICKDIACLNDMSKTNSISVSRLFETSIEQTSGMIQSLERHWYIIFEH